MAENLPIEPRPARRNPFSPSDRRAVENPTVYDPYARKTVAETPDEAKMARQMHREYIAIERIKEADKTRRVWHTLAVACIIVAAVLVTFAPTGREVISYWTSGTLLLFGIIAGLSTLIRRKPRSASPGNTPYAVVGQEQRIN